MSQDQTKLKVRALQLSEDLKRYTLEERHTQLPAGHPIRDTRRKLIQQVSLALQETSQALAELNTSKPRPTRDQITIATRTQADVALANQGSLIVQKLNDLLLQEDRIGPAYATIVQARDTLRPVVCYLYGWEKTKSEIITTAKRIETELVRGVFLAEISQLLAETSELLQRIVEHCEA